jgi:hypothetical protein
MSTTKTPIHKMYQTRRDQCQCIEELYTLTVVHSSLVQLVPRRSLVDITFIKYATSDYVPHLITQLFINPFKMFCHQKIDKTCTCSVVRIELLCLLFRWDIKIETRTYKNLVLIKSMPSIVYYQDMTFGSFILMSFKFSITAIVVCCVPLTLSKKNNKQIIHTWSSYIHVRFFGLMEIIFCSFLIGKIQNTFFVTIVCKNLHLFV